MAGVLFICPESTVEGNKQPRSRADPEVFLDPRGSAIITLPHGF